MKRRSLLAPLVALLLALSCTTPRHGEGPMDAALEAVRAGGGTPREKALYGWYLFLTQGDPGAAKAQFEAARDDALGLAGLADLARRSTDPLARIQASAHLAALDPKGALGRIGAHTLLDLVGQSPALDAEIRKGAEAALAAGAGPGVALLCRLAVARVSLLQAEPTWRDRYAEAGALTEVSLAGPLGGLRRLDYPATYPPQTENALRDTYATPTGEVRTRPLRFPQGDVRLFGEPERGDIFFLGSDFTAKGGGYVLTAVAASPFDVWVDGAHLAGRPVSSNEPQQQAAPLMLGAGPHRLLVKLSRAEGGSFSLLLSRDDGQAEDLHFHAATGPAPAAPPAPPAPEAAPKVPVTARELFDALEPELGDRVARYLAARDSQQRDPEGAKALLADLAPVPSEVDAGPAPDGGAPGASGSGLAPAWLVLRAQSVLGDHSLPDRISKSRAGHDLAEATARDPGEASAWLMRAYQARDEDRLDDAAALVGKARTASRTAAVELALARVLLARGLDAEADAAARHALELTPSLCEAMELRYDLARRNEAVKESDQLEEQLLHCADGLERAAEHARVRGDLAASEKALQARQERAPTNWRLANDLVQVLLAQRRYGDAKKLLESQLPLWPRLADLHKRLAEVATLAGDDAAALTEKRAALALDGSDLALRRQLALREGHDLLDDLAVDGKQAIAEYQKAPPPPGAERAQSAYVLDFAGIEALPDGTQVERIHTIAQVLDQRGIPQLAEQHLPGGAIVLKLQTVKKDGRVLEPETIGDKEGVSLPNVDVGDFVEVEYLGTTGQRSPAEPGFASVPFYFRIADTPLFRSVYTFRAPAGVPLKVDAHNMEAPAPQKVKDQWVVHRDARNVPLFIPEPGSPGANEYLPMMQVGTGAGPLEGLLPFADSIVGRDLPTLEVTRFAKAAAGEKQGLEAVQAVYGAVMDKVKGESNDINDRASTTLARERGSRLWLLKGALRALDIPAHLALVRPLSADPAPYAFPNPDLYTYPVLLVELPGQAPLWLDPSARFGPFGRLPETVAGEREAAVLPNPGEAIRLVKTPAQSPDEPKTIKLALHLDAEGNVTGEGSETYKGFDAAFLRQALERYDDQQRRQAVEVALARSFRGAVLDDLVIRDKPGVGEPMAFEYKFHSPRFARADGRRLALAIPIFPAALGQRYVALAKRTTPLLVGGTESSVSQIRFELPAGYKVTNPGLPANIATAFGSYKRATHDDGPSALLLDEATEVKQGRISPQAYPDFVRFAAAVDQAQNQEIDLTLSAEKTAGR